MTSPPDGSASDTSDHGARYTLPGAAGQGVRLVAERAAVLHRPQLRQPTVLVDPEQQVAARCDAAAGRNELRGNPSQRRGSTNADGLSGFVPMLQPTIHRGHHMASVQSGAVGGVDGVQQVADCEHPGSAGPQAGVHHGPARRRVHCESAGAGQFVVGDPVAGEHHGVAVDRCP